MAWPAPGGGRGGDSAGGPLPGADGEPPLPSSALIRVLDHVSGPDRRCAELSVDETFEVLGRWDAVEAWCASAKLGVIRALIRHRPLPGFGPKQPGGLPEAYQEYLTEEVALELGISRRAADALIGLAWALEARLVLTARALDAGVISLSKARIIDEATSVLTDQQAAEAEALIAGRLAGQTHGQIAQLIARAVVKVDPEGARKRREEAQREDARVQFWREHAGTAALAAFGLPPDQALAANQNIQDKALEYRAWGVPGTLDQLRVLAFLDSINGTDARQRYPKANPADAETGDGPAPGPGEPGSGSPVAANTNLTIPLLTVLGMIEHPGEAHGLGTLDPDLARQFAASAARHPGSRWCVTVTDQDGHAIGHGCAKPRRGKRADPGHDAAAGNRRARVHLRRRRSIRRIRHLAPVDRRPGPTRQAWPDTGHRLRPPLRIHGLPALRYPSPPGRDPRRPVHPAGLRPPGPPMRLRARAAVAQRRPNLRLQRRMPLSARP